MWQHIATLSIVGLACAYIAWQSWRVLAKKKAAGCGSCSSCPGGEAGPSGGLVPLQTLSDSAPRPRP